MHSALISHRHCQLPALEQHRGALFLPWVPKAPFQTQAKSSTACNRPEAATKWGSAGSIFIYFLKEFYCYSITVVCLFSPPLHPTPAEPTSLLHLHHPPWFCPCVLYSSSCNPLFSLSPPDSPLAIVRLFLTSISLVIFCLLFSSVDYVPVKGEIIWYLSLTTWLEQTLLQGRHTEGPETYEKMLSITSH